MSPDPQVLDLRNLLGQAIYALAPFSAEYAKFKWVETECDDRNDDVSIASCQSNLKIRREFRQAAKTFHAISTALANARQVAIASLQSLETRETRETELPACAAICYRQQTLADQQLLGDIIIAGRRHGDCLRSCALAGLRRPTIDEQGFMTTLGRFVDREEAMALMRAAGRESAAEGGYRGDILFSEDLY